MIPTLLSVAALIILGAVVYGKTRQRCRQSDRSYEEMVQILSGPEGLPTITFSAPLPLGIPHKLPGGASMDAEGNVTLADGRKIWMKDMRAAYERDKLWGRAFEP